MSLAQLACVVTPFGECVWFGNNTYSFTRILDMCQAWGCSLFFPEAYYPVNCPRGAADQRKQEAGFRAASALP